MDDSIRQLHTEIEISAYEGYLPEDWGEKTLAAVSKGSVLEQLLLDLGLLWRTASYTAQMPATSIRAMHAAAVGRGNYVTTDRSIVNYTDAILAKLSQRVPDLVENRTLRAQLVGALASIADEFRDKLASVKEEYPIEPIWTDFLQQLPFRLSLWSSQRLAFVAFYNAYEAFLVHCLKIGIGLPQLRSTDKKAFNEALRTSLGRDIAAPCWSHHEINIARLVRHALSHAGGRETEDLKKQPHGIKLIDGVLQIVPNDIHKMFRRLRLAVDELIAAAAGNPRFSRPASDLNLPPDDEEP